MRLPWEVNRPISMKIDISEKLHSILGENGILLGGIFIWVTLPENVDTKQLERGALKEGIAINPGAEWTANGPENRRRIRLCFGHPAMTEIREGIARLASICHREFGVPKRISNIEQS